MSTQPVNFSIKSDPQPSTLTVFKDAATGRLRWLAVSSTAFKDRDGQIVSTKALEQDVARTDAGADLGPLRFWHVPGLDIGTTDYSAMSGRTLIESGTFIDERLGQAVKDSPKSWGISLGFLHPHSEPDSTGTFNIIQRFERSLVPAGRASNLFTRLVIKEVQMLTPEKVAEFKDLVQNDPDILQMLLGQVQQAEKTEKTADAAGVTSKDTNPLPDIAALITTSINAAIAPMLTALQSVGHAQRATATKEIALQTSVTEQAALITTLKAKIDASDQALAALTSEQTKLKAALAELLGDQPANPGYRASQANDNIVPTGKDYGAPQAVDFTQFFNLGQQ